MANLDFYSFFDYDSSAGDTYEYTSTEFSNVLKNMVGTGILNSAGGKMAASANGLAISIATGACFINGRFGTNNSIKTLNLDAASGSRFDRVILRVDTIAQTISLEIKKGTASAPPDLAQTDTIYEISICKCSINGSTATLTDEREFLYTPTEAMNIMQAITSGSAYVYAVYA